VTALAIRIGPCVCAVTGCDREWPRDPVLEVACPDCHAAAGVRCKRPSGHSGSFVTARDLAADAAGAYGPCPLGRCGLPAAGQTTQSHTSAPPAAQGAFGF
jgi:hypothetical protein